MSECTCHCCHNHDLYRLLAFAEDAQMDAEVNRPLKLNIGWKLLGELIFANGVYRREMVRIPDVDARPWLLPNQSPPVQH